MGRIVVSTAAFKGSSDPPIKETQVSASKTLWIDQLKVLTERRRTLLEKYEPLLTWAPWSRDAFEHQLTSISAKEVAILGMHDDLQVLVRNSVGAPKNCYHLADR